MEVSEKNKKNSEKPIQPTLKSMELYDKESFPIHRLQIVKVTAGVVSTAQSKKFKTKVNRIDNIVEVTRIA